MKGKLVGKKGPKGLSIFQRLLISYLVVGIIIVVITGAQYYLREQKAIKEDLKSQFLNALNGSIAYFDRTYTSRINEDLSFIEKSYSFNSFLSSQKEEILVTKSLAEQLFLYFTNRPKGIYLSMRFIDSRGIERVITSGNKRLRDYVSLDNFPPTDILHSKIYTLFERLKSEKLGAILFEEPFEYGGKFTFVAGISKSDPEIGGFAGVVIFHCDLTDYFNHLDGYVFYKEHVASVFTLDDELIFTPGQNSLLYRHPDLLKKDNPLSFYSVSDAVKMGLNNQALFKVMFSISPEIFNAQLRNAFKNVILYIFVIMALVVILALVMSRQFSTPLVGLAASANRLAKGDLSTRVNVKANGEIGLLIDSFNQMVEDLQETIVSRDELAKEVTERKKAETELYRVNRTLKTLTGCNQRLIRATEKFTFLSEICQIIVGVGGYRLAWIGVAEQDEEKSVRVVAQAGFEAGYLETLNITWADTERGQEPAGTAIRTGKTCICRNILTDPKFAPWRDEAFKRGYASSIAFPIQFEDKVIGALNIYATATDAFNESEVELLTELSNDLAYGIVTLHVRDEHKKAEDKIEEQKKFLEKILESLTYPFYVVDVKDYTVKMANSAAGFGDLSKGLTCYAVTHKRDSPCTEEHICPLKEIMRTKKPVVTEHIHYDKDGNGKYFEVYGEPIFDKEGNVVQMIEYAIDITERKRMEEVLRESENRYRLLADNVTDVIFITDLNLRFTYISPSVIGMFGYSVEEVVSKRLEEFLTLSSIEVAKKALAEEIGIENNQGKGFFRSRVLELEIISKDGSSKWAEVKTTFLRDSNERPTSVLGICRDLTERMEAEAALIQTNERLQYLLSSTSAVIYTSKISGDHGVTYITGNIRQITEYEPREFTENSSFWIEHVHPEDRPRILEELPRIFEQGFHIYEYRFLHKNGTYRWIRDDMKLERDREGKPLEIAGIWIDITERKLIEEKIKHAAEEWRTTFDSISDMVSIHDRNFKIIRVNKAYANFLKKRPQEVIGNTCYELFHGSKEHHPYCPHVQTIQTKKPTTAEFFDSYTGVYLEVFCSPIFDEKGEVIATVHIARDITLRKEMEKTQRLTQLGKLVADMAHEVNNPLMVISGRAQLSLMEQIQNEVIKNNLKIIFEECQRARDIIQRLLSFSRPSKGELKEVNINRSIETVVGVVEHQFKLTGTEIKRNYMEKPPAIVADEKQIQEVVMNLLNNAKDAMPKGGVIEIVTSSENDFLRIDFKDTGSGISEGDIKRMFEPFFTTKKEGTGLGLSLCYGIVKAHGGDIKIESKFGKGTVVTVFLPVREALGNA